MEDSNLSGQVEKCLPPAEWNATEAEYPRDICLHQLFEAQVRQTPDAVAAVFQDEQITYRKLSQRANQLANYLIKSGVKPDTLIGIYVERSLDMLVGLLGILKAGAAYVPMDPSFPPERLSYMMEDANISPRAKKAFIVSSVSSSE